MGESSGKFILFYLFFPRWGGGRSIVVYGGALVVECTLLVLPLPALSLHVLLYRGVLFFFSILYIPYPYLAWEYESMFVHYTLPQCSYVHYTSIRKKTQNSLCGSGTPPGVHRRVTGAWSGKRRGPLPS